MKQNKSDHTLRRTGTGYIVLGLSERVLELERMGSNDNVTIFQLCDIGQIVQLLCAFLSSFHYGDSTSIPS